MSYNSVGRLDLYLRVARRELIRGFWDTQERYIMTDTQAANKAVELFIEWGKGRKRDGPAQPFTGPTYKIPAAKKRREELQRLRESRES